MADQILSQELFERNETEKRKLLDLIRSKEALLLAGAGVTANLFVDWKGLVKKYEDAAIDVESAFTCFDNIETYLDFFDRVKAVLGDVRYSNIILKTFETSNYNDFHKVLVSMPFKGIVTTNYDKVLENALNIVTNSNELPAYIDESLNAKVVLDFLKSLNYSKNIYRRILHLHGVYYVPKSIILSQSEYMEKYGTVLTAPDTEELKQLGIPGISKAEIDHILSKCSLRWTTHRKMLWSILATRRVVFMGFSITDPYFLHMLDMIQDDLNTYDDEVHIAIFRLTQQNQADLLVNSKKLKAKYGIDSVFFEDDSTYAGFERFINEIGSLVGKHESIIEQITKSELIAGPTSLPELEAIPVWMNLLNQAQLKTIRNEDK